MRTNKQEIEDYAINQGQRPPQSTTDGVTTPDQDSNRKLVFQTPQIGDMEGTSLQTLSTTLKNKTDPQKVIRIKNKLLEVKKKLLESRQNY